jgi:predicted GNAT family N-acyltransferase
MDAHVESISIFRATMEDEIEACLEIRFEVFVGEQHVPPEEEIDGIDDRCIHYLATADGRPVGTARIIPKPPTAKIGRVAVVRSERGLGVGTAIMQYVLEDASSMGFVEAVLDAQTTAIPFYEKLGFVAESGEFLDAGIPHRRMRRRIGPGDIVF